MPLFMDVHHTLPQDATREDVEAAHQADLGIQDRYRVKYLNYWLDETERKIFCLVEAPDIASARDCHREAHGLIADEIHEVVQG